jgi:tetratricopeptide (TPR) repeat protein
VDENDSFRAGIDQLAILLKVDAEKGEGIGIARDYHVSGYPNFILTTAEGEIYDRWLGYGEAAAFTATLSAAADDPMTIAQRRRHFAKTPNAVDAEKIAELEGYSGYYGEAIAWYDRAEALGSETFLAPAKLELTARGWRAGLFDDATVMTQAELVLKSDASDSRQIVETVALIDRGTRGREDRGDYITALKLGVKRLKRAKGAEDQRHYAMLMTDHALHVKNQPEKAFDWKLKSMPEGWRKQGDKLNSIAWWCFENNVALDEAEQFARKGVQLSEGPDQANVMDTLAEICNAKGDCGEALDLIKAALAINPDNDYLKKQLVRFEELLKEQQG